MIDRLYNVLFLCTGNSARSIMAECAINRSGLGKFRGFSAGSHPKGKIHPMALRLLERLNYRVAGLRSKDWAEFAEGAGGPPLDFVFPLCDSAAGEVCPAWPGQPMTAHWVWKTPPRSSAATSRRTRHLREPADPLARQARAAEAYRGNRNHQTDRGDSSSWLRRRTRPPAHAPLWGFSSATFRSGSRSASSSGSRSAISASAVPAAGRDGSGEGQPPGRRADLADDHPDAGQD